MTTTPLRSQTSTIDIYIKLAQYPILSDTIRARMREMLFTRGIIDGTAFEAEVRDKAIESRKREGTYDPFNPEPHTVWQKRKDRIRNFQTDSYFANNFPTAVFELMVEEVLSNQGGQTTHVEITFNPELAPWSMLFQQGQIYESMTGDSKEEAQHHLEEIKVVLIKRLISEHLRFIGVAKKTLTIDDLRRIYNRRIGEGKIGGKAAGMVLAWKIANSHPDLAGKIQIPESYFIGSDVTYEFRRYNGMDHIMNQKYRPLEEVRAEYPNIVQKHLAGQFPPDIVDQLREVLTMLEDVPIIVRSSSLLEDNFGFSFAGKYDSYFCPNQGTAEENLQYLLDAIRRIYASTLNPDAILYRQKHGLIDYDERMAILLQTVRGERHGRYYFPTLAGVGFSQNAYRWNEKIRREDGFLRLVWGMGTRAVDRLSSDYPRLIALSHPHLRPETRAQTIRQYSQHFVDVIDLQENLFKTLPVEDVLDKSFPQLSFIASIDKGDYLQPILSRAAVRNDDNLVLTFDKLVQDPKFVNLLRTTLTLLEKKYEQAVDTEFTVEITQSGADINYILHILQCRPLSLRQETPTAEIPADLGDKRILFRSHRLVPDGQALGVRYIVFIDPTLYRRIPEPNIKRELGRAVSRLNHILEKESFVLMGPGRWGSSNLELGVRVSYGDIHNTKVLIEMGVAEAGVAPELSYGTHFFQDLVEGGIYSLPLHLLADIPHQFDWDFFQKTHNILPLFSPDDAHLAPYLRVIDVLAQTDCLLDILMNGVQDEAVGYLRPVG